MSLQIAVRIPKRDLDALDLMVAEGEYESRAAGMRAALELMLRADRERRITASYRAAYSGADAGADVGDAGAALAAEIVREQNEGSDG